MIVGVAVRNENILITLPRPNRHCDCFRYCMEELGFRAPTKGIGSGKYNQGFITDEGLYLDRWEASKHVSECGQELLPDNAGQIKKPTSPLISEDVW